MAATPSGPTHHDRGTPARRDHLVALARATTGFMPDDEGLALMDAARVAGEAFPGATFVEIGAWCGKSATYLGAAAEETGAVLFSLDHHHGSEENQAGWEHHDTSVVDPEFGLMDTLGQFRKNIARAGLEDHVIAVVGQSATGDSIPCSSISLEIRVLNGNSIW